MTTPYFLIDADKIEANLKILRGVMDRTGCKILLAQKCFSCYGLYPLIRKYLAGATASGLYEARLCHEEMVKSPTGRIDSIENHIFSPAYQEKDMDEILRICDHIVFNSPRQLALFGKRAKEAGLQVGLRINPECSTQEGHAIYDPCAPGSRLGTRLADLEAALEDAVLETMAGAPLLTLIDGLHFHTLCEQNSDDLARTLDAVVEKFGKYLSGEAMPGGTPLKWINFGGGHHITRADYDIALLESCINRMKDAYNLQVYLEPGEAVALNAGTLHTTVLEVQPLQPDGIRNAILDMSAACHTPDVIEMPYTPPLIEAEGNNKYRFGGPTCLSGDVIDTYSINRELHEGDELIFGDMAIYSMVKTNTFNGMPLPAIYIKEGDNISLWKKFTYDNFKTRV